MKYNHQIIIGRREYRIFFIIASVLAILLVYFIYTRNSGYKLKCDVSYWLPSGQKIKESGAIVIDSPGESALYWKNSNSATISGMGLLVNKRVDDEKYRYTIKDPEGYPDSTFIIDRSTLQGIMKDGYWSGGVNLACSEASNKDVEKARDEYKAKEKKDGESRNERVEKNKI